MKKVINACKFWPLKHTSVSHWDSRISYGAPSFEYQFQNIILQTGTIWFVENVGLVELYVI